jgi:hypothetical protein
LQASEPTLFGRIVLGVNGYYSRPSRLSREEWEPPGTPWTEPLPRTQGSVGSLFAILARYFLVALLRTATAFFDRPKWS